VQLLCEMSEMSDCPSTIAVNDSEPAKGVEQDSQSETPSVRDNEGPPRTEPVTFQEGE
jgi:hypothetical protein